MGRELYRGREEEVWKVGFPTWREPGKERGDFFSSLQHRAIFCLFWPKLKHQEVGAAEEGRNRE